MTKNDNKYDSYANIDDNLMKNENYYNSIDTPNDMKNITKYIDKITDSLYKFFGFKFPEEYELESDSLKLQKISDILSTLLEQDRYINKQSTNYVGNEEIKYHL